eukprot:350158-Chlamydomonas_euryale.AAC.1
MVWSIRWPGGGGRSSAASSSDERPSTTDDDDDGAAAEARTASRDSTLARRLAPTCAGFRVGQVFEGRGEFKAHWVGEFQYWGGQISILGWVNFNIGVDGMSRGLVGGEGTLGWPVIKRTPGGHRRVQQPQYKIPRYKGPRYKGQRHKARANGSCNQQGMRATALSDHFDLARPCLAMFVALSQTAGSKTLRRRPAANPP